ncbi:hypothetical protein F4861DRAFT_205358 [Xylaria intraflava]|nr:hypothetical protein F4861DRAFT_205358 [Xylaria intraflava]
MESCTMKETFYRVTAQPGSTAKRWDKEELLQCRAVGTGITAEACLQGHIHPIFARWVKARPEFHRELEQPILLASKILEATGLPWLSDFLIDDIFDEAYPGRERDGHLKLTRETTIPHSVVRHSRAPWATLEKKAEWVGSARDTLRKEVSKLIHWRIDENMFQEKGWNGYTCRHPRGDLPLSELDRYDTIKQFDRISTHEGSRSLTIMIMAEYPARLAELRRQGKSRSEEYLLTAFMVTVTLLHEIGHAIYWKDRRALTRDLREPFYGSDLEMELGDSFIAAIFGGWIPVPVCRPARLRKNFSFADGVAWRQALSWDHHRMRPKYRAHYSIPIEYIRRLFTQTSWSTTPDTAALVRPQFLTGDSAALRTVGLHTPLTQTKQHATAAIADFHCTGEGWAWNRRSGARFRIPQYDGCLYPEFELPTAAEYAVQEPKARVPQHAVSANKLGMSLMVKGNPKERGVPGIRARTTGQRVGTAEVRIRGRIVVLPSPTMIAEGVAMGSSLKGQYSPPKFTFMSPPTKIPRPIAKGSPMPGRVRVRKRDRVRTSPLVRAVGVHPLPWSPSLSTLPSPSAGQVQGQSRRQQQQKKTETKKNKRLEGVKEPEGIQISQRTMRNRREPDGRKGTEHGTGSLLGGGEISVDELRQRLSVLIGVSLTELESLFEEGPRRECLV